MERKRGLWMVLGALALLIIIMGALHLSEHPIRPEAPETNAPTEAYAPSGDFPVAYQGNLTLDAYPEGTPAGDWLAACSAPDRDDQFEAYVLRHEAQNGESTTFTYLIYYRHGASGLSATPSVFQGENGGRRVDLTYAEGDGTADYALCRLSVTLPAGEAPRLRLLIADDTVGYLSTVSQTEIP